LTAGTDIDASAAAAAAAEMTMMMRTEKRIFTNDIKQNQFYYTYTAENYSVQH